MLQKILKFLFLEIQRWNVLKNIPLHNFSKFLHYSHIYLEP